MVNWDRVTRADVMSAMREYDHLGPERFFAQLHFTAFFFFIFIYLFIFFFYCHCRL